MLLVELYLERLLTWSGAWFPASTVGFMLDDDRPNELLLGGILGRSIKIIQFGRSINPESLFSVSLTSC